MTSPPDSDAAPSTSLGELLAPVRGKIILACVLQAIGAAVGLVPFIAIVELGRELFEPEPDNGRLWTIAVVAAVSLVVRIGFMMGALSVTHFADNDFQLHVRRRLADQLGALPLGWFDDHDAGEVKKLVVDDVSAMHHVVGHVFTDITASIVTPVVAMIYLFTIDWQMGLIVLVPFVIGVALFSRMFAGYGEKMEEYNARMTDVNDGAVEFVQGIAVVKTFGQSGRAHRRFLDSANRFVDAFWNWVSGMLRSSAIAEIVLSPLMTLMVIAAAGAWFVDQGWISAVDLVAFFVVGLAMSQPISTLGFAMNFVQSSQDAAARIGVLLDAPTLPEPTNPRSPEGHAIEFDGVSFSYDGDHTVLADVDLEFRPGTMTALVGPSGSGKSTLAKLLCRFWDPTAGAVRLGGVDLRDIARDELYGNVGFVFQDVQLLRMSVADNIALARPSAGRDEIEAAARAAQIHERITELPGGYDAVVHQDARFSGGEAQRLSIARAILADAPILVLDEATSFADPESEAAIQDALSALTAGRTLIVIAHRLSTIVGADQIVVLDAGSVVETGTHDQLLDADGLYARQWAADQRSQPAGAGPEVTP
ncbi:MAG: ABC transporter ATP-binding protein [Actinomycetota bacterium]